MTASRRRLRNRDAWPASQPGGELSVALDLQLPHELAVGRGSAVFVAGRCFHRNQRIAALNVLVDGERQPVIAHGMPRLDYFAELHEGLDPYATAQLGLDPESSEDPLFHSYRSGFWAMARIGPAQVGVEDSEADCDLSLEALLEDGRRPVAELGRIRRASLPAPLAASASTVAGQPPIAICMATYNPPRDLFSAQIRSIRSQTHENWVCLVSDDCSHPERLAAIRATVGADPRFIVSRSPRRLGFYRNFERALAMVPRNVDYVALADQDDFWYPEKLQMLLAGIGGAELVYSDSRVIDGDGELISSTYWSMRRNNHSDLLSLLVANSVSGAASLFRRELLEYALPFPPAQFAHFHDHWIGLTALAVGEIAFVDRPLYDYVQHRDATLGHAAANRMLPLRTRLGSLGSNPRERVRMWRLHYFVDVARLTQCATILRMRCDERMAPAKRRTIDRFLRTDHSLTTLAGLWRRGARELLGRPETLGAEWMLAYAFTWRRLLAASARERPMRGPRLDAVPPPDLVLHPRQRAQGNPRTRAIAEKIAPLDLAVSGHAPQRVNILIPTIDLAHFFGGYIGKLNLARRLAEHGQRVRIVTVDPVGPLPHSWKRTIESYSGLAGLFAQVELAFGREERNLEVSRSDAFIATTWWTAHIAQSALAALSRERFLYLIQEYEPFTFPMGTYAALARESYSFSHCALFSSELLRDYFRRHAIGVYGGCVATGEARSASFQNAITAIEAPSVAALAQRTTRRLLFYARPEPHASRNLFELGVLALQRALRDGALGDGWELNGIGTVAGDRTVALGGGAKLDLLPRSDQSSYAKVLPEHDLGLALMYTPHPSLVPIEMASAGMLTVTNSFENKTQETMTGISPNLLAPPPTIDGLANALAAAADGVGDFERRVRGSAVNWSRDWNRSFSDELIRRVTTLLGS